MKSVVYVHFLIQKAKCITYSELTLAIFADLRVFKNKSNTKLHFKTVFCWVFFLSLNTMLKLLVFTVAGKKNLGNFLPLTQILVVKLTHSHQGTTCIDELITHKHKTRFAL